MRMSLYTEISVECRMYSFPRKKSSLGQPCSCCVSYQHLLCMNSVQQVYTGTLHQLQAVDTISLPLYYGYCLLRALVQRVLPHLLLTSRRRSLDSGKRQSQREPRGRTKRRNNPYPLFFSGPKGVATIKRVSPQKYFFFPRAHGSLRVRVLAV